MKKHYQWVLPALLCSTPALSAPFTALEARSMAMGETGVASSKGAGAAIFNPALLSGKNSDDLFSIILPNVGGTTFADSDALDAVQDINDDGYLDNITDALDVLNEDDVTQKDFFAAKKTVSENARTVTDKLLELSDEPINIYAGGLFSVSIPNDTLGVAVFANVTAVVELVPVIKDCDQTILNGYIDYFDSLNTPEDIAASYPAVITCPGEDGASFDIVTFTPEADDPADIADPTEYLDSEVFLAGVTTTEIGVALSRVFNIANQPISFGVTPKLMTVTSYFALPSLNDIDDEDFEFEDEIEDNKKEEDDFNIDLGVSTLFLQDTLTVGLVIKNALSKTYTTAVTSNGDVASYKIEPQIRAGVAWHAPLGVTLAADLDLLENDPYFRFGEATQYLGLGAEWDIFSLLRLRGGMRTNLVDGDDTTFTAGVGFNIVAWHFDLAAQIGDSNGGAALQMGFEF